MSDNRTWNERLIAAIAHCKITRGDINNAALAEVAGVKPSTFGYWVHTKEVKRSKDCGASPLLRVCKHLGINPYWVMLGEGVMEVDYGETRAVQCINDRSLMGITEDYPHQRVINYKLTDDNNFEPRIYEDDLLYVDTADTKLKNGKLYLFESTTMHEHYLRRYFNNPVNQTYSLIDGANSGDDEITREEFEVVLKTLTVVGAVIGRYTTAL